MKLKEAQEAHVGVEQDVQREEAETVEHGCLLGSDLKRLRNSAKAFRNASRGALHMALNLLMVLPAALLCPTASRPALQSRLLRASVPCMEEGSEYAPAAWPTPARTVAELRAAAKEAAEAEALANPRPFASEDGGFSVAAMATLAVFVIGGALFFQGITGSGVARFAADQSTEVQACIQAAKTREDASSCLPPVPVI